MFIENCRLEAMIGSRDCFPKGGLLQFQTRAIVVMVLTVGLMAGCGTGSVSKEERDTLVKQAQASRQEWNKVDPQFEAFAKKGYGYAFFPEITKGGFVVGGARGQGMVYEKGQHIGYADLTQMSAGFQAGFRTTANLLCSRIRRRWTNSNETRLTLAPTPQQCMRIKAPPRMPSL
jgi:hypothetical protein